MFDEDGFDLGRDPKAEANASTVGFVCALVVFFIALQTCLHLGNYTAAGSGALWHLLSYAVMCGGGWGCTYYAVRWIERNMAHATMLALMVTVFAVAAIKGVEFTALWILAGSEHTLEWLALAVNDPIGWLFTGDIAR